MNKIRLLRVPLAAVELLLALTTTYVVSLAGAALLCRPRREIRSQPAKRFAILIPAHNEELLLGRLFDSLAKLEYPRNLVDIYVVADNCSDNTSSIARQSGARIYERKNDSLIGKGYALRWLLDEIVASGREYDAFVVFDADSVVSPNFLRAMNDRLLAGRQVIQAHYAVANPTESWNSALRCAAFSLVHYVRPRGKSLFGGSAGLKGNGMCFAAPVIEKHEWNAFSLAEDVEYHLQLVSSGITVDFAPEAVVWAEMPSSLRVAKSQNLRWEQGRLEMARKYGPRLLWSGLVTRNLAQVDAAVEQFVPPFSVSAASVIACLVGGIVARSRVATLTALALCLLQMAYVISGLVLVRAPRQVYTSLLRAPLYVVWKIWLYVVVFLRPRPRSWERTSRQ